MSNDCVHAALQDLSDLDPELLESIAYEALLALFYEPGAKRWNLRKRVAKRDLRELVESMPPSVMDAVHDAAKGA
jgi:hypothetical protein